MSARLQFRKVTSHTERCFVVFVLSVETNIEEVELNINRNYHCVWTRLQLSVRNNTVPSSN